MRKLKKLSLNKATVANLERNEMRKIQGGNVPVSSTCSGTCATVNSGMTLCSGPMGCPACTSGCPCTPGCDTD